MSLYKSRAQALETSDRVFEVGSQVVRCVRGCPPSPPHAWRSEYPCLWKQVLLQHEIVHGCESVLMFQGEGHEGQAVPPGRKTGLGLQTQVTQLHCSHLKTFRTS